MGNVKRAVFEQVMNKREFISGSEKHAAIAQKISKSVEVIFVSKSLIKEYASTLDNICVGTLAVPNTRKIHFVHAVKHGVIKVAEYFGKGIQHNLLEAPKAP